MNILMVLPKRSRVYRRLRRAICSRYLSAAGDTSAMKSSTDRWLFERARRTSASVFDMIFWVISSQLIFFISS